MAIFSSVSPVLTVILLRCSAGAGAAVCFRVAAAVAGATGAPGSELISGPIAGATGLLFGTAGAAAPGASDARISTGEGAIGAGGLGGAPESGCPCTPGCSTALACLGSLSSLACLTCLVRLTCLAPSIGRTTRSILWPNERLWLRAQSDQTFGNKNANSNSAPSADPTMAGITRRRSATVPVLMILTES